MNVRYEIPPLTLQNAGIGLDLFEEFVAGVIRSTKHLLHVINVNTTMRYTEKHDSDSCPVEFHLVGVVAATQPLCSIDQGLSLSAMS